MTEYEYNKIILYNLSHMIYLASYVGGNIMTISATEQPKCSAKITLVVVMALSVFAATNPAKAEGINLAIADSGYGEYLSGECVTCHQKNGSDQGIPSITGLDAEAFSSIMLAYRNKELDNNVMQTVASRLDDEQIASLAVYFASLPASE